MTNGEIIAEICQAMMLGYKIKEFKDLYEMDAARFDKKPNELKELFQVMLGPSKGEIAFKIYKSRTNT